MMTRRVRIQLVAFVIIALVGVAYVGARYVRLDQLAGIGIYKVDLEMPRSGGLYPNAEVTYRGIPIGRVGKMSLTKDGISAQLLLKASAPKVPASARAVVADRSAIGEQYVDLQPSSAAGPYLREGSVVRTDELPMPVDQLIAGVDTFAQSVPLDKLRTTVEELGKAFDGKGDDLQVLVDSLNKFTAAWHEALPQTITLIRDGRTVLDTQAEQSASILRFSDGLDKVTAQLKSNDPDIRRLIGTGKHASDQIGKLLVESGPSLTTDLTNLRLTALAISPKTWALQPVLQQLPALSLGPSSTAPGDNTTHFGLVLETNNPPACTQGYEGTQQTLKQMKARDPNFDDTRDEFPLNTNARCTVPQGSVTGVRGGPRAELADPALVQPWDNKPKTMPDTLNLTPLATQMAPLLGITYRR